MLCLLLPYHLFSPTDTLSLTREDLRLANWSFLGFSGYVNQAISFRAFFLPALPSFPPHRLNPPTLPASTLCVSLSPDFFHPLSPLLLLLFFNPRRGIEFKCCFFSGSSPLRHRPPFSSPFLLDALQSKGVSQIRD